MLTPSHQTRQFIKRLFAAVLTEMAPKIKVKERITDGEIDLSMSDLDDVPVKEIV